MAARLFGYTAGFVYLMFGTLGFVVTGFEKWVVPDTEAFIFWFRLNGTLNLVHMTLGAALMVAAADSAPTARAVNAASGFILLALGVAGFWLIDRPNLNVLALNGADIVLHLVTGAAALAAAVPGPRPVETA